MPFSHQRKGLEMMEKRNVATKARVVDGSADDDGISKAAELMSGVKGIVKQAREDVESFKKAILEDELADEDEAPEGED